MDKAKIIAAAEARNNTAGYTTGLSAEGWTALADEPKNLGGNDEGASPAQYLCMALASCKAITLRMYANRKGWKVTQITVNVAMVKGGQGTAGLNTFFCAIKLEGELTKEQEKRLLNISKICPIDRLLQKPNEVVTRLGDGTAPEPDKNDFYNAAST